MWRLVKWLVILAILGGIGAASAGPVAAWWKERNRPQYVTATPSRGRIETVVNSTGTVKPVRTVSVGAFTSGPIADIYVDYNSKIDEDQVLARIDPKLAQAAVDRDRAALQTQKAELSRIEALLQQARNNEERAKRLAAINKDYLSDTEMDTYKFTTLTTIAQRELAIANITQAEANLQNSLANLGYTKITSPVDGIVIERKVDPGQTVAASFQTPELFIVAPDMDKFMLVYASVDEADIGLIQKAKTYHRPVKFTVDAYPGELFEGKIEPEGIRRNATTTQNVVTYPVIVRAPNPGMRLMPSMTANLSFQIEAKEDVLRLPASALRYVPAPEEVVTEDRHYVDALAPKPEEEGIKRSASEKVQQALNRQKRIVWIQDGDLLRAVPITLGLIENQWVEIVSGLSEDQAVVTGKKNPVLAGS